MTHRGRPTGERGQADMMLEEKFDQYLDPAVAKWIVVNTQPHRERLAINHLANQNYKTYCPMIRRRICHARKLRDVLRPLFPGYLFVAVDPVFKRWRPILSTLGVRSIIRNGDNPSVVDPELIAAIRSREIGGAVVRPASPYQIGDNVKMSGGPFDGVVARIVAMDDRERLTVLLDLLGGKIRTAVRSSAIVPTTLR